MDLIKYLEKQKEAYLNQLRQLEYSSNTIEKYNREIDYFIQGTNGKISALREINRSIILEILNTRQKLSNASKIADKTKIDFLNIVRQFILFLSDDMSEKDVALILNSLRKIRIRRINKTKSYLTSKEINRFLSFCEQKMVSTKRLAIVRNTLLVKLLFYCGMRISEALNMRWDDIRDSEKAEDMYMIKVLGKGKKENYVFIKKDVINYELKLLKSIYEQKGVKGDIVFVTERGKKLTRVQAYIVVSELMKKAGICKKGLHIFRHSLGFSLAAHDVPIVDIQEILRHSSINTTRIYVQREESKKLENLRKIY